MQIKENNAMKVQCVMRKENQLKILDKERGKKEKKIR